MLTALPALAAGPRRQPAVLVLSPAALAAPGAPTAATTTTTATAATTSAAATAAAAAAGSLLGFLDVQSAPLQVAPVQVLDRGGGGALVRHLDEGEAARPTGVAIENDLHLCDVSRFNSFKISIPTESTDFAEFASTTTAA